MSVKVAAKKKKFDKAEVLADYAVAVESREASLLGRKEVFMGKAKFGIFGDGKELAQIALAKYFKPGDFRSGYYRDQTILFATGELTTQQYFAQLYAHMDVEAEPASAGRMMNGHYATRSLNEDGSWKDLTKIKNSSADASPTASQMPRLVGLAQASKYYRENKNLDGTGMSNNGNEIAFGTIGNASTSEGPFFEAINAGGVMQIPMVVSVWDDGYGISVPAKYQTTKEDISEILSGFQREGKGESGYEIIKVKGWDYPALLEAYEKATAVAREEHVPVLIHVTEVTQPQGHSTSGSHERYKSKERMEWEKDYDCNLKFREWIVNEGVASEKEIVETETEAINRAKKSRTDAWKAYLASMKGEVDEGKALIQELAAGSDHKEEIEKIGAALAAEMNAIRKDAIAAVTKALRFTRFENFPARDKARTWINEELDVNFGRYSSHLLSESPKAALNIPEVKAVYKGDEKPVDGREVLQACFDSMLERDERVLAFGEDVGKIGDVNQAFAGLQEKFGEHRVFDTGIRECTIMGQGIGMAMRGLRPIAEIQYLDYLLYGIQILSDDLATLQYRTKGGQKAPMIIRTRGHRLEGIWHSGSPMGMILHSIRGIHVLVPRNMTQAAGFYNTIHQSDEPALIVECLNGYRLKEKIPANISEFTLPLGVPEVIREGADVTVVTYGSMCRLIQEAANQLSEVGISVEIIDVQSLLPFDIHHSIVESVKKTNRVVFADEDVSGGASAFMMQQVIEKQKGYYYLDSEPKTIHAKDHRPAYGTDGDYFSKPNVEDIFGSIYDMMHEVDPEKYPQI